MSDELTKVIDRLTEAASAIRDARVMTILARASAVTESRYVYAMNHIKTASNRIAAAEMGWMRAKAEARLKLTEKSP